MTLTAQQRVRVYRISNCRPVIRHSLDGLPPYRGQRHNPLDTTALDGLLGHAEFNAAFFILGQSVGTGLVHLGQACSPIITRTCHDDAQRIGASGFCNRPK